MDEETKLEISPAQEPQNVREFNERGWIYLAEGEFIKAEADFRQALLKNNRFADAFFGLGVALKRQDHIPDARAAFEKAVSFLGKDTSNEDRVRLSMLRRLAEDHLKVLGGEPQ